MELNVYGCFAFKRKDYVTLKSIVGFANLEQFESIDIILNGIRFVDMKLDTVKSLADRYCLLVRFIRFELIDDNPSKQRVIIRVEQSDARQQICL